MGTEDEKINKLRERISEATDLLLFDEATRCLDAKAYRAAYIITWICTAESIRNKLESMSQRDSEVGKILKQIENAEKSDRPTDKLLLDSAFNLGIMIDNELKKLDHMRDMRNIYAHPTGTGPSEDEVLAALTISVEVVLSKPPLLRHGYVENLLKSLFEDYHFLDDIPVQIREYATGVAHRVHPDIVPYLLEQLLDRLEQTMDDPSLAIFRRRGLEFGTTILKELSPKLSDDKWNIVRIIQEYPSASSMIFSTPEIWTLLPAQAKDMVLGHLAEPVRDNEIQPPTIVGLQRVRSLDQNGLLNRRQSEKVVACTKRAPCQVLAGAGIHLKEYKQRILEDLASHNWYTQNPACSALYDAGIDECSKQDKGTQEQLGRNILQAADGNAKQAEGFITSIIQNEEVWPRTFVEGIILETLVNENREFRLKEKHFGGAILIAATHPKTNYIFNRVIKEVTSSKPKSVVSTYDYDKAIQSIDTIRPQLDTSIHKHLDALEDAINCIKSELEVDNDF